MLAVVGVALTLTATAPLGAQTGAVSGEVVDTELGQPVAGALILSPGGARARTDALGQFTLLVQAGETEFAIVTPWCTVSKTMLPPPGMGAVFQFQVEADRRTGERARSQASQGKLVTATQIEEMRARTLTDVLERVAPDMIRARSGQGNRVRLSGRSASLQGQTRPVIVMDGVVLGPAASDVLASIRPDDIAYLELQRGANGGWEYGTGGSGGVVRIVSKKGSLGYEAGFEAERCPNLGEVWPNQPP